MVRTSSEAELLESQVMAAGIQVVASQPADGAGGSGAPVDQELVRMALEAQGSADCGVSWYYTDRDGNVSTHLTGTGTHMCRGGRPTGQNVRTARTKEQFCRPVIVSALRANSNHLAVVSLTRALLYQYQLFPNVRKVCSTSVIYIFYKTQNSYDVLKVVARCDIPLLKA